MNTKAYGAKITLKTTDGNQQYQELYPVRGYQSTVTQDILFGLSKQQTIQEIIITWPNNKETILKHIEADQTIEVKQSGALIKDSKALTPATKIFSDITATSGITFRHQENDFIDFKDEVLLPYQLSRQGPALAKADVNGDGLEDVFIGGAIGQSGKLYLQTKDGKFTSSPSQPWVDRFRK